MLIKNGFSLLAGTGVLLLANIYLPSVGPTGLSSLLGLMSLVFGFIQLPPTDSEVMNPGTYYTL